MLSTVSVCPHIRGVTLCASQVGATHIPAVFEDLGVALRPQYMHARSQIHLSIIPGPHCALRPVYSSSHPHTSIHT